MRRRRDESQSSEVFSFNATAMVDVIFLLTIFFMLVTRFSSAEQIPMQLPKPDESHAEITRMGDRVIINCRLADSSDDSGRLAVYSVGPNRPEPLSVISERLATMKRSIPDLAVVIRADRRLHYAEVRAVMGEVARHGIDLLNVVAHISEGDSR